MQECCCDGLHTTPEQAEDCRERAACHEAGHALALCLVHRSRGERDSLLLNCLTVNLHDAGGGRFPLPEGRASDPWTDAFIQLGGLAAEDLFRGEQTASDRSENDDWQRAERLLRSRGMHEHIRAVFRMTKELFDRHRSTLENLTDVILKRKILTGLQIWEVVEPGLPDAAELA